MGPCEPMTASVALFSGAAGVVVTAKGKGWLRLAPEGDSEYEKTLPGQATRLLHAGVVPTKVASTVPAAVCSTTDTFTKASAGGSSTGVTVM